MTPLETAIHHAIARTRVQEQQPAAVLAAMSDREHRPILNDATIRHGLAWQVRTMRTDRGWTQRDLARRCRTKQPVISNLENPNAKSPISLSLLERIASAFDVALLVRFEPWSDFLDWLLSLPGETIDSILGDLDPSAEG